MQNTYQLSLYLLFRRFTFNFNPNSIIEKLCVGKFFMSTYCDLTNYG